MFVEIKATPAVLARWAAFRCQDPAGALPPVAELAERELLAIHDGDSRFAQRALALRPDASAPARVGTEWGTCWLLVPVAAVDWAQWRSSSGLSDAIYDAVEGTLEIRTTSRWPRYALSAADVADDDLRVVLWDEDERVLLQAITTAPDASDWERRAATRLLAVATMTD